MKFIRCFAHDFRQGIWREYLYFLPVIFFTVIFCVDFYKRAEWICGNLGMEISKGFWDYFIFVFGGMRQYVPSPDESFIFPAIWMVVMGYASFITVKYPFEGLETHGQQILVRIGKRSRWWLSKCLWVVVKTTLYYLLVYLVIWMFCTVAGDRNSGSMSTLYVASIYEIEEKYLMAGEIRPWLFFAAPVLTSLALNMLQLVLNLFMGAVFPYVISLIILISSAYCAVPGLIGNGAMLVRSSLLVRQMPESGGLMGIEICIAVTAAAAGYILFQRKDILKKEE